MRVFVAGATGVIGRRIVPLLLSAGHDVAGMTRTPAKAEMLRALGAEPVVCDVYDAEALLDAVTAFAPHVVVSELTDLPDDETQIDTAANARMRIEGHRNLLAAAGTAKLIVQSVAWRLDGEGAAAVDDLERSTLAAGGVVLRYGRFYGPGTYSESELPPAPRVQIDDAARRTVEALDAPSGVVVIA
jgi:NAD(P)-dependent dehydrogenase (short-subunit alcohol dehydrogenase family)